MNPEFITYVPGNPKFGGETFKKINLCVHLLTLVVDVDSQQIQQLHFRLMIHLNQPRSSAYHLRFRFLVWKETLGQ